MSSSPKNTYGGRNHQRINHVLAGGSPDRRGRVPTDDRALARLTLVAKLVLGWDAEKTLLAAAQLLMARRAAAGQTEFGLDSAIRRVREIEAAERKLRGDDLASYVPPDPSRGVAILERIAAQVGYAAARHILVMALTDRMAGTCEAPEVVWECNLAAQSMVHWAEHPPPGVEDLVAAIARARAAG
jgi:hypothetical protein